MLRLFLQASTESPAVLLYDLRHVFRPDEGQEGLRSHDSDMPGEVHGARSDGGFKEESNYVDSRNR